MIPKYAYRVEISKKIGENIQTGTKNFETLVEAMDSYHASIKHPNVISIRVLAVLHENSSIDRSKKYNI